MRDPAKGGENPAEAQSAHAGLHRCAMEKKQQQQVITLGVLVLVLVVAVVTNLRPKRAARPAKPAAQPQIKIPEPQAAKDQPVKVAIYVKATPDEVKKQLATSKMEWVRDPFFRSARSEVFQTANLILKGVSLGKGDGYALVNDQILTIGDTISGYMVKEVTRNKVLLQKGPEHFYLVLPEE